MAARSPARSSAGPLVMRRLTSISAATIPDSVVLPRPGGPANSRWSAAWPRPRAAARRICRCSLSRGWPTNSASWRGRSVTSSASSTGSAEPRISSSLIARVPYAWVTASSFSASRRSSSTEPSSGSWATTSRTSSGAYPSPAERDAHLRPRRRRVPPLGEVELGYLEAGLELHQQPLRGALADPGHHRERGEVVLEQGAAQAGGRMHRQHRQRELRADAGGGDQRFEGVALVARREAVEHHRVLTHVQVGEQERGIARVQRGQRAGRHERPVPDAPDLDQHLAGGGALDHGSPHRPDHLASSLATAAAMASASRGDAPREGAPPACGPGTGGGERGPPPVAERERERVGGVGWIGHVGQLQEPGHHLLHLVLAGGAVAGDRELHLVGAVVHDRYPGAPGEREREPARLAHRHGGARVHLEEHPLDRHRHRRELHA